MRGGEWGAVPRMYAHDKAKGGDEDKRTQRKGGNRREGEEVVPREGEEVVPREKGGEAYIS